MTLSRLFRPPAVVILGMVEGDRVVIADRENLAASQPDEQPDVGGDSRTSRLSPPQRGKQQLSAKEFAWEMQRRHEVSLDDGMARNVLYRQSTSTDQVETERTWTIVVEP